MCVSENPQGFGGWFCFGFVFFVVLWWVRFGVFFIYISLSKAMKLYEKLISLSTRLVI